MARLLQIAVVTCAASAAAAACADDPAWYKTKLFKTCDWVAKNPEKRCDKKGFLITDLDGAKIAANDACTIACGTCTDLLCTDAESQSPRDVTAGSVGLKKTKAEPLSSVNKLAQVNTHYHEGAEHFSGGEYDTPGDNAGGYYCDSLSATATPAQLEMYEFEHCRNTKVGGTYELHWVYSSGGSDISDGLGGAFARQANPLVVVQAQVFLVVNDEEYARDDLMHGWVGDLATDAVKYLGSTTGTSYDNEVCSPVLISWHVDRSCHMIAASTMDAMCRDMAEMYKMSVDLEPHGSRVLVSPENSAVDVCGL